MPKPGFKSKSSLTPRLSEALHLPTWITLLPKHILTQKGGRQRPSKVSGCCLSSVPKVPSVSTPPDGTTCCPAHASLCLGTSCLLCLKYAFSFSYQLPCHHEDCLLVVSINLASGTLIIPFIHHHNSKILLSPFYRIGN